MHRGDLFLKTTTKNALILLHRLLWFIILLAGFIILLHSVLVLLDRRGAVPAAAKQEERRPVVILDPGHGGMDSGAVSGSGVLEKDLNLRVASATGAFLEEAGVRVIYTRTEDALLTHPGARTAKQGDLMGRVALAEAHPDALFVSIHMNTLPQEQYSGLQVFYSANDPQSRVLAQALQDRARTLLQPENRREIKKAGSSIFVLDRIESTAVLVECGFLSNTGEASLLADGAYQKKLGYALSRGILDLVEEAR